jgi:hypothetical protein
MGKNVAMRMMMIASGNKTGTDDPKIFDCGKY